MADKRIKPPGLMSRSELREHMTRFHGENADTRYAHNSAHHFKKANHSHRSMKLSETEHKDWKS